VSDLPFGLTLFVSGASALSSGAIVDARRLCDVHLGGRHDLKIVDLHEDPTAARDAGVFASPTLLLYRPSPARKVTGDLSNTGKVLSALGLPARVGRG
jgi:circadian clock protein KaiB